MARPFIRLLFIEDDPADADRLVTRLAEAPDHLFTVVTVDGLQAARELLTVEPFDVVALDLGSDESAGLDELRMLVRERPGVAIVAIAGSHGDGLRKHVLEAGAHECVTKLEVSQHSIWRSFVFAIERLRFQNQQQQIERLVSVHSDPVVVMTAGGLVRFANHAALELFAQSREDFLDQRLAYPLSESDVSEISIKRSNDTRIGEMRVVRFDWRGEPALLASIRDITDLRESAQLKTRGLALEVDNQQIRERNRLKTDFLAQMSHELRTPLNAIIGFAQLLFDGEVPVQSPQHHEFLGDILTSGHYLLKLINDVLDIAKVEAGHTAFRPQTVMLPGLISEICSSLRTLAARKQVDVSIETEPGLREVVLDPLRFRQILQNYLANALRFTPAYGRVTVRALIEDADLFRLEVEDTGVGIDAQGVSEIFSEFSQLKVSAAVEPQDERELGTGLGLAVTKRLVEAQGGSVGVRSVPGHGSTFFAVLPRRVGIPSWPPPSATLPPADALGGVLVIVNTHQARNIISDIVSDLGLPATYRSNGPSGLEAVQRFEPAAVVIDTLMQGMDGFEFVSRLRGLPVHGPTPVIAWHQGELSVDEQSRLTRLSVSVIPPGRNGEPALRAELQSVLSTHSLLRK